ncbi:MAG TPA: carboxymuconolactone decarboxylase family protein [Myxococcota bacterium]|nr:carboxymuconolactone decarboxylase family protein [Myxococcota bacterium]
MDRIPPLEAPFTLEVAEQLGRMMPAGAPPIALFRTFARNLEMARAMHGWGSYELSKRLSLSLRAREIAILRTCARCGCEYEWGVHVASFAPRAELTPAQLRSLTAGLPDDACWEEPERTLIAACDSLHAAADVDDALWSRLAEHWSEAQILDLLLLCGWYHAISFAARAARVPLETFAPRFADYGGNDLKTSTSRAGNTEK